MVILLLLTGCSKGPDADLQYISQARSLGAEWALINEQSRRGSLTATYTDTMHKNLRDQLQTASKALSAPDSAYGVEIEALLSEPDDATPGELRAHVDRLKQIEDSLESA
jgi:hypothetical protein